MGCYYPNNYTFVRIYFWQKINCHVLQFLKRNKCKREGNSNGWLVRDPERALQSPKGHGQDEADGNPVHLLRHPHGKRGAVGGQDRTKGAFGGCLTLKLAVNAELMWGNCILAMKNGQKIRPKRLETDIKLKF